MSQAFNYQPWLQSVLVIAKHYRIEPSEERIRLQLDWNQNHTVEISMPMPAAMNTAL